jgi:murein DD-endopeptidase MepM/ murein hydrolase activator NlpD
MLMLTIVGSACTPVAGPPAASRVQAALDRDIHLPAESAIHEGLVPRHATLDRLLGAYHVRGDVTSQVVTAVRAAFDPRAVRQGQAYKLVIGTDGQFRSFEYTIDADRVLRVAIPDDGSGVVIADIKTVPKHYAMSVANGLIDAGHPSLIAAVTAAGEGVELALRLADLFGGQLDFNTDLQPGDRFEMLFEKDARVGQRTAYGSIVAASVVNSGRRLQAFRFADRDGRIGYFDEHGRSVERFFLRSPLPFLPRITSRFSLNRLHPVRGVRRAHLGVDYAAPTGTPVLAVAGGVVVSAGFSGASGRLIRLRHANAYQTYYLHLSSIAKGIRPGKRVSQGDVIGRVGASGVVTGPHLDYRLTKRGVFVNPLVEQRSMAPSASISAERRQAFAVARDEALEELQRVRRAPRPGQTL